MITGLYRHYKGSFYLALFRTWESDNDAQRVRRVVYLSLWPLQLDDRTESEFIGSVERLYDNDNNGIEPRFKRVFPPWQPKGAL